MTLMDRIFEAQGQLRCRNCSGAFSTTTPAVLAELHSRSGTCEPDGILLAGAFFDPQRLSSVSSKKSNKLKYFEKKGLRRFVMNDTLYRFDNTSLKLRKTDSLVACNDSLPAQGAGKALLLSAFAHGLSLGSEIGVVIEYLAGKVGRRWYFARDPFCPNCFRTGSDAGERMLDGVSWETSLKLRIDELLTRAPTLASDGQLVERLATLCRLGLGSIELGRYTKEISAGEALKLHVASALFRELSETLYVLDEPSRVLHPFDLALVVQELRGLIAAGCGVIVIDRNVDLVRGADEVIELGGMNGGELLFNGPGSEWRIS
jgi:hypothetical protein